MNMARLVEIFQRHRLMYAIAGAIAIGLLLTAISLSLYISSGASRLDLSRPGYEKIRTQVTESDHSESFSSNGPINVGVVDEFQKFFTSQREKLNASDDFESSVLNDSQLRLSE